MKAGTVKVELPKKEVSSTSAHPGDDSKKVNDAEKLKDEEMYVPQEAKGEKPVESENVVVSTEDENNVKTDTGDGTAAQKAVVAKTGKKKIVKRIVKRKVATKKQITEDPSKQNDVPDKEDAGGNSVISEVDGQKDGVSSDPPAIKTFIRKKIVKKSAGSVLKKDEGTTPEVKTANESEGAEENAKVKLETGSSGATAGSGTKTTVKRKIVKMVPKKKAVPSVSNVKVAEDDAKKVIQPEPVKVEQVEKADEDQKNEIMTKDNSSPKINPETVASEKQPQQVEKRGEGKDSSGSTVEAIAVHQKVSESDNAKKSIGKQVPKDGKERTDSTQKKESDSKASKVVKEKRKTDEPEKKKIDEPPRHPGVILQTKGSKESKVGLNLDLHCFCFLHIFTRSLMTQWILRHFFLSQLRSASLSLDSLLDYSNKDLEESNFEV